MPASLTGPLDALPHALGSAMGRIAERTWLLSPKDCDALGRFEVFPDANFGVGLVLSATRCSVVVGGPITERFLAEPGEAGIHWIRFRPGLLPRIADVVPAGLVDAPGIELDRLLDLDLDALGERLVRAPSVAARLRLLDQAFLAAGEVRFCQDRRCRRMLEMVDRLDGVLDVQGLAREFGLSVRSVQRTFLQQVGLTPKQLIANVRLQRALARLRAPGRLPGSRARLAAECGFADQSHMIRDLKRHTGRTPGELEGPVAFVQDEAPSREQDSDRPMGLEESACPASTASGSALSS
ncbi:MAG TPA: helix-turn-helix transcriptional regulator [Holophaga sp.]|nr:helix-turn-helix transcriptional regulator [Holophaga sp.]